MFYLTTHSTHFIYGYMASARVLLYASSHKQDNTYHSLCYTSRGALAGTRNMYNKSTQIQLYMHDYYTTSKIVKTN